MRSKISDTAASNTVQIFVDTRRFFDGICFFMGKGKDVRKRRNKRVENVGYSEF